MPVRIITQKQVADRRRGLRDCYICGTPIPTGTGWRKAVINEHVIPKTLLGEAPRNPAERWAVTLNVHAECERTHKRSRDHLMKLLQSHTQVPAEHWNKADAARLVRAFKLEKYTGSAGVSLPALSGNQDSFQAAGLWVRGMHAALYGNVLPNPLSIVVQFPVPNWSEGKGSPEQYADMRRRVLGYMHRSFAANEFDELRAWGDQVIYQCTWVRRSATRGWLCAWVLEFPGTHEWAMEVHGRDTPWHGCFAIEELPEGASVCSK